MNKARIPPVENKAKPQRKITKPSNKVCSVADCHSKFFAKELCKKHYGRYIRRGLDPSKLYDSHGKARATSLKEALDSRYVKGVAAECWEWIGPRSPQGYGCIKFEGKRYFAHRLSYEFNCGTFEAHLFVCHSCDNPPCVNPGHLFLGTALDNNKDRDNKGRQARGIRHGRYKHGGYQHES